MSSSSRRKKSFENKQRQFQNRNIIAGVILAVAVGFAIWLMVSVMGGNIPHVYLSTNYVVYSGTQKTIPFALKSCEKLVDSFESELEHVTATEPLKQNSDVADLKLSKNIRDKDILFVYFNGHLVPGEDKPVEYLLSGNYEGDERRGDFGTVLKNINDARGKLKILLIDAGRYTRSPVFPAREPNDFQNPLAEAIKRNNYQLDDNFWIIVSHSKHEFSRVSTPLESSLFSKAVAASVEHFANKGGSDLSALEFYLEVRKRTASWSRNFGSHATQTPILMHPSKGRILDNGQIEGVDSSIAQNKEKFQWKVAYTPRPEEDPDAKKEEDVGTEFKSAQSGSEAAERLLENYRYDSLPRNTVAELERFLDLGEPIGSSVRDKTLAEYTRKLSKEPDNSQGVIIVDDTKLGPKQAAVQKFRRALLGVTLLARFQNELRHWQDVNVIRYLDDFSKFKRSLSTLPSIPDNELTQSETVPQGYEQFTKDFEDFYIRHKDLLDTVRDLVDKAKVDPKTPTQAEMLGRISERYLPIIAAFKPRGMNSSAGKEDVESKLSFKLDLIPIDGKARFDEDMSSIYGETMDAFGSHFESANDTAIRFRLAAQGSESVATAKNLNNFEVAVPNIKWIPLDPGVKFSLTSGSSTAEVNPTDPEPIEIRVEAKAIGKVDLAIDLVGNNEMDLHYTLVENDSVKSKPIPFNGRVEEKLVNVWISNKDFNGPTIAVPFKITATWNDGQKKVFDLEVKLSKDADLDLIASRKLGEGISEASLIRWGRQDFSNYSGPLMVKSLANIETGFDFSVQNKSQKARNLSFKLYNIRAEVREMPSVRADRGDRFDELSGWLAKIKSTKDLPSEFQLLGKTKPISFSSKSDAKPLEFEKAKLDDAEESEQSLGLQEVKHCLLLVGTNADTEEEEWFQWIGFNPKMPADYSATDLSSNQNLLAPLNDIIKGIKLSKPELERQLKKSWPKKEPAARLDVVSPGSGRKAANQPELKLDRVFAEQGGQLRPGKVSGAEQRILIMELFGVPGYRVLRQSSDGIVRFTERNLVGVKVETEDSGCVCYPTTWSLLNFDASGKEQQTIFIRPDPSFEGDDREVEFKFLLPGLNANALAKRPDYWLSWNGGKTPVLFPNSRKHFVQLGESGISFKSTVSSHVLPEVSLGNIADERSVLEVYEIGKDTPIGSWQFKTESFADRPSLTLSKNKVSKGNLVDVRVTADISKIRSPIELSAVKLLINGKEVPQFFKKRFGKGNPKGVYEFNLGDLADSVEFGIGTHRVELSATDFFGEEVPSRVRAIKVEEPKKQKVIVPKVKAKVFENIQLKLPTAISRSDIKSLKVGDTIVPWTKKNVQQTGIVAARRTGYVKVFFVPKGKYSFTVTATILNDAETRQDTFTFKKTAEVNEEGQVIELE
jgi:hypothetical protein